MSRGHEGDRVPQPPYRPADIRSRRTENPLQSSNAHFRDVDPERPSNPRARHSDTHHARSPGSKRRGSPILAVDGFNLDNLFLMEADCHASGVASPEITTMAALEIPDRRMDKCEWGDVWRILS
ncbi:hypothetical protein OCU04_006999 [Sclerotinia nivalis]|uniref:Uncharacterized protein n=1 Tax=Sclerotinia nivalis TaxID=352851 RepID=A0A9X0APE8_9HELO|nr:hypothetical protein OCU04_006999 [Sclerotinia nivalis]